MRQRGSVQQDLPRAGQEVCRICGDGMATLGTTTRRLTHGREHARVEVDVVVPTWSCEACDMSYLGEDAEAIQHDAICARLGRLSPREILAIRKEAGLTQKELAQQIEVGIATLKRWESGLAVQDRRNDLALRGLGRRAAVEPDRSPQFRTVLSESVWQRARRFQLRLPQIGLAQSMAA